MNRPNTPLWDPRSAVRDDPILSRLFEIEIERLYLTLSWVEQLALLAIGIVAGLWFSDYFNPEYDTIYLFVAILPWLTIRSLRKDPSSFQNLFGLRNHLPKMLTRWVLLDREDKWPHRGWLSIRRLFRTPAGAIRFARQNNITLKDFSVMWVDGYEHYQACYTRREGPSRTILIAERSRLLCELKEAESE